MDKYLQKLVKSGAAAPPQHSAQVVAQAEDALTRDLRAAAASSQNTDIRAAASVILERMQFLRQAGITFNGARDLYQVLGYDRLLTNRQYRDRYCRGGIAGRVVDAMVNATWRGTVQVLEKADSKGDSTFEKAWAQLDQRLQIQARLRQVDLLSQLSTYAVLLVGAKGQNDLGVELQKGKGPDDLIFLSAFSGGGGPGGDTNSRALALDADCTILQFVTDASDPRFALPASYQLKRTDISSPNFTRPVHWSRIIHIAEGCLFNDVYGLPALERVWNLLDDLEKVTGGGAEAFWLRANQGLHLDIDKDLSLPDTAGAIAALTEQSEEYKHQQTRWLRTRGVDVKTLGSDVANFQNPADAIMTQIAGAKAIPKRILTGSEQGELASSQDRDNWKDQVNGRQVQYVGPNIIRQLVTRLIDYNFLPAPTGGVDVYEVKWPHIEVLTEDEKSKGANQWADTNAKLKTAGMQPAFSDAEIREKWYGLEPMDEAEREKAMLPAPEPIAQTLPFGAQDPNAPPVPTAAEEELLHVLAEAVEANNTDVIDRLLGVKHAD